jgi:hypothetical protein
MPSKTGIQKPENKADPRSDLRNCQRLDNSLDTFTPVSILHTRRYSILQSLTGSRELARGLQAS